MSPCCRLVSHEKELHWCFNRDWDLKCCSKMRSLFSLQSSNYTIAGHILLYFTLYYCNEPAICPDWMQSSRFYGRRFAFRFTHLPQFSLYLVMLIYEVALFLSVKRGFEDELVTADSSFAGLLERLFFWCCVSEVFQHVKSGYRDSFNNLSETKGSSNLTKYRNNSVYFGYGHQISWDGRVDLLMSTTVQWIAETFCKNIPFLWWWILIITYSMIHFQHHQVSST